MTNDKPAPVKRYEDYGGMVDCETRETCSPSYEFVRYDDYAALEAKYQRLVGVVEKAPHAIDCDSVIAVCVNCGGAGCANPDIQYGECDCWKSEALREAGE